MQVHAMGTVVFEADDDRVVPIEDAAWSYEEPLPGAIDRVGTDFAGHVAFDRAKVDVR